MSRIGIIQSSYIPWRGYFDLIDDVDLFVVLDDVQYSKGTWRNRNRVKTPNGSLWLTVPVTHELVTLIRDVEIDYRRGWVDKHVATLRQSYGRAPFFREYAEPFFDLLAKKYRTISELNVAAMALLAASLGITTPIRMSSDYAAGGRKEERVLAILEACGATAYLSGPAAKSYIDPGNFARRGIALEYKSYDYPEYRQLHGPFEPQVTVLDLLFNCGPQSREYLKSRVPNEAESR